jgi:hypothetical protein
MSQVYYYRFKRFPIVAATKYHRAKATVLTRAETESAPKNLIKQCGAASRGCCAALKKADA